MKRYQILLILAVFVLLAAGCGKRSETAITKAEQLNNDGIVIGVPMTTPEELVAKQLYPKARIDFYKDTFLGYQDVKNGKIDAYIYNKSQMELAIRNGFTGVKVLDETIGPGDQIAIGLSKRSKIPNLQEQVNAFIKELKADGTLDDMYERWIVQNDYNMPEIKKPANPTMHLIAGTVDESEPFNFYEGATITISYAGPSFDPADSENDLSYTVVKKMSASIAYTFDPEAELPNMVVIRLSQG